ncbi:MAG TPA: aldehyde dehydrogenase family protein [Streptosporangiaceae bacterium]|nr:aldehyde dehydrogenase family protein [Streptosporangiaceae bacterium]
MSEAPTVTDAAGPAPADAAREAPTVTDAAGPAPADAAVAVAGAAARSAASALRDATADCLDGALIGMADRLAEQAADIIAANADDVRAAKAAGMADALVDRLRLDASRVEAMADQLRALAQIPAEAAKSRIRALPDGLELQEWRRPVGVIGANFEARPGVVVDVASQLIKSRNAGVLRTGSSAIKSAVALIERVVGPAMTAAGLPESAIQLVRVPGRESAFALVRRPGLIPLVILRGSGDSTRELAREAALHGVRTLAHADGGAVIYVDRSADTALALQLIERSLDRLGVCNRLNLLLVQRAIWDELVPQVTALADRIGVAVSLPPHRHALGHEWALDDGSEATITLAPAEGAADAAEIANQETSGLAASIVAADSGAASRFLDAYSGTGAFWNSTPRLLDGFKLLSLPETGINIDVVPGPRGPVTFRDLYLRQYVVVPKAAGGLQADRGLQAGRG